MSEKTKLQSEPSNKKTRSGDMKDTSIFQDPDSLNKTVMSPVKYNKNKKSRQSVTNPPNNSMRTTSDYLINNGDYMSLHSGEDNAHNDTVDGFDKDLEIVVVDEKGELIDEMSILDDEDNSEAFVFEKLSESSEDLRVSSVCSVSTENSERLEDPESTGNTEYTKTIQSGGGFGSSESSKNTVSSEKTGTINHNNSDKFIKNNFSNKSNMSKFSDANIKQNSRSDIKHSIKSNTNHNIDTNIKQSKTLNSNQSKILNNSANRTKSKDIKNPNLPFYNTYLKEPVFQGEEKENGTSLFRKPGGVKKWSKRKKTIAFFVFLCFLIFVGLSLYWLLKKDKK
ncbi:hypothetical protein CDIK_2127 [Cucumispora dikerogammari]|nr:hypothetical protein CDIK_2127 [Cucumispora dikerogammari]